MKFLVLNEHYRQSHTRHHRLTVNGLTNDRLGVALWSRLSVALGRNELAGALVWHWVLINGLLLQGQLLLHLHLVCLLLIVIRLHHLGLAWLLNHDRLLGNELPLSTSHMRVLFRRSVLHRFSAGADDTGKSTQED